MREAAMSSRVQIECSAPFVLGMLLVQMLVDGEVVKEARTAAQYGVVSVTYTPGE